MASIDNRIVRMDFENARFQRGVADTLSSLQQLTQGIQGISSINGMQLEGISSGVERIGSKFTWLNAIGFSVIQNLTSSAMGFASKVASTVLDPLVEGGKRRALNIEQARFQFKGLGMDVEASMDSARQAVLGTAYGLDEAAKVASILGTSGMKAGDEMTRTLRAVAGTAAMSGSSFMDVGDIFTDVFGKGRVQAEDFNRLAARGVGAAPILAKYLRETGKDANATEASVREMASKGKIDAQTFADAMSDAFGEHATRANETYTGSLANMRAAISRIGASFAAVKFEKQRKIFNELTPVIDAFAKSFQPVVDLYTEWSQVSGDAMIKGIQAIKPFVEGLTPVFQNFTDGLRNIGKSVKSFADPIKNAFKSVFDTSGLTEKLLGGLTKLTGGFSDLTKKMILSESAQKKVQTAFEAIFSIVKGGIEVIKAAGRIIEGFLEVIGNFGKGFKEAFEMPDTLFDSFKKIGTDISNIFKDIGASFDEVGQGFGRTVAGFVNGVLEVLGQITSWIHEHFSIKDVLGGILGVGLIQFIRKAKDLVDKVKEVFEGFKGVADTGGGFADGFKEVLGAVGDALNTFTTSIKVWSLVAIAGSIALLASALNTISEIDPGRIVPALSAMGTMFAMLSISLASFTKIMNPFTGGGLITAGISLLLVSAAIKNLVSVVEDLGKIDAGSLAKGLISLGIILTSLRIFLSKAKFSNADLTGAASLVIVAYAMKDIAEALQLFADIDAGNIAKGLAGMAGVLVIFSGVLKTIGKINGFRSLANATAILIISKSLRDIGISLALIGRLPWDHIGKGLAGMGGAFVILSATLGILGKFTSFKSIFAATAVLIAVQALEKIGIYLAFVGRLPWPRIEKALGAMGWALGALGGTLTIMGKVAPFGSVLAATAILIVVQSLEKIGDALKDVGALPWSQIQKGLGGMGWAIGGLGTVLTIMGKISPVGSILGATALLIAVQSLEKIGDALKTVGDIPWPKIQHGLVGLGGALGELAIVLTLLGTISPVGSILGATALLIAVQSLDDIADAMKRFGNMSWDEIARGLVGMGGALGELGIVVGLLGSVAPIGGILGAGAILIGVQGLGDIADAMKRFGNMSWDEIARGLVGMGGALGELAIITGVLGTVAGLPSLLGGGAILLAVQGLGDIADALNKFGSMSWDEIGRGLSAMGGALGVIAFGTFANTLGIIGAMTIDKVAVPLGQLADSVKKWADVTVPDGLGGQLATLARGVESWNFAWLGGVSISAAAVPLGQLADSVKKWSGVTVPDGLGSQLASLAKGVQSWSWAFLGDFSMLHAVGPLAGMADSVKKWADVTVPDGLGSQLASLAKGVQSWSWAFLGDFSMLHAVGPLAGLADSVKKWADVTVPDGLGSQLASLAKGVQSWSWAFLGDLSIAAAVGPLGDLAGAVKKWKDVEVPDGMESNLKSLANGINHWWTTFGGGFSMGASVGPLGDLAGAVKKWKDVKIPDGMESSLKSLANGIAEFGWFGEGSSAMADAVAPVGDMAVAVKKWNDVNVISDLGSKLSSLASGIKSFDDMFSAGISIAGIVYPLAELARSVQAWNGVSVSATIGIGLVSLSVGLKALVSVTGLDTVPSSINGVRTSLTGLIVVTTLAVGAINRINSTVRVFSASFASFANATRSGASSAQASISQMVQIITQRFNSLVRVVRSFSQTFSNELRKLGPVTQSGMRMVVSGIASSGPMINSAARGMVSGMMSTISGAIRSQAGSAGAQAVSIGYAISAGMARGILAGAGGVAQAARVTALRALNTAKAALGVASPSKEMTKVGLWFDDGFARGILQGVHRVTYAAAKASNAAVDEVKDSMSGVDKALSPLYDIDPTIKPLVDLSDVEEKYSRISALMSMAEKMSVNSKVAAAAYGYDRNINAQQEIAEKQSGSKIFEYTQNNYSPKALSNAEIYRRTKNQLSIVKGELDLND